jgi:hypothetical protein
VLIGNANGKAKLKNCLKFREGEQEALKER